MFGFVKKEDVVNLITKEVELNRKMYDKYTELCNSHSDHTEEGECYKREKARCSSMADEYFARYQQSKELLNKVKSM